MVHRFGLRPGSVRLWSRALDVHFSRALVVGVVPRPPPGLSPRANFRDRAPPPSRTTVNRARLAGSCGDSGTKQLLLLLFASFLPRRRNKAILSCLNTQIVLDVCGLLLLLLGPPVVAERRCLFNLSGSRSLSLITTSLRGSPSPSSTPFARFGTRLPGRVWIRVLLCTSTAAILKKVNSAYYLFPVKFSHIALTGTI